MQTAPSTFSRHPFARPASFAQGRLCAGLLLALTCVGTAKAAPPSNKFTAGRELAPLSKGLQAGDYIWKPEASPAGPVVAIVSIPEQTMYVYRNGVRIGRSTVSTGKPGKRTPTGVFTILEKKVKHTSSIYKGAQMPHMQRLTWRGVAMHAGNLPGYPASAGCVRMPVEFAEKFYQVTSKGSTVIITDQRDPATGSADPGLMLTRGAAGSMPAGGFEWQPEKATTGPVSIIFSLTDSLGYVYRNGVQIGRTTFVSKGANQVRGTHIYAATANVGANGRRQWLSTTSTGGQAPDVQALAAATTFPAGFATQAYGVIVPGSTLILTDLPVSSQTRSGSGFSILTAEKTKKK